MSLSAVARRHASVGEQGLAEAGMARADVAPDGLTRRGGGITRRAGHRGRHLNAATLEADTLPRHARRRPADRGGGAARHPDRACLPLGGLLRQAAAWSPASSYGWWSWWQRSQVRALCLARCPAGSPSPVWRSSPHGRARRSPGRRCQTRRRTRSCAYSCISACLVAAAALLGDRVARACTEPCSRSARSWCSAYALAGRLLPELIELAESDKAFGRLEQPITYWNAEGALAAFGFVLAARLAGDATRPAGVRALAAAAAPLARPRRLPDLLARRDRRGDRRAVVLLAAAPTRAQLRAAALGGRGRSGRLRSARPLFPAVASLGGRSRRARSEQGAIVLGVLLLAMVAAGALQPRRARERSRRPPRGAAQRSPAARRGGRSRRRLPAGARGRWLRRAGRRASRTRRRGVSRLTSVDSSRYDYWRVGLDGWTNAPLRGLGAGGFRVEWLRERPVEEGALEVHSLPLEMLIELGLSVCSASRCWSAGVAAVSRRALRDGHRWSRPG